MTSQISTFTENNIEKLYSSEILNSSKVIENNENAEEIFKSRLINRRVRLNVGGQIHEIMWSTLKRMPHTRLGKLLQATMHSEIMKICDDYNLDQNEYFFDRHPKSFDCVITMFRSGSLHMQDDMCVMSFSEDLEYWGINESLMEHCCQHNYHMKKEQMQEELKKIDLICCDAKKNEEKHELNPSTRIKNKIWNTFENPQTSTMARVLAVISITFIMLSVLCLTLNTMHQFQVNKTLVTNSSVLMPNGTYQILIKKEIEFEDYPAMFIIECVCIAWFTIEYVLRLFSSPNKKKFLKSLMNTIDIVAILPFYASIIFINMFKSSNIESLVSMRKIVQVFRILRILRILKLARHFMGLQALGYTLKKSYKELGLLMMFIALGVLLFSSLMYFAEKDIDGSFVSIPSTFWWAIITMTTVGYGDMTPKSALGKLIGSFCCICGVLVIALPIPIIVNNFAEFYKNEIRREKALKQREEIEKGTESGSLLFSEMIENKKEINSLVLATIDNFVVLKPNEDKIMQNSDDKSILEVSCDDK